MLAQLKNDKVISPAVIGCGVCRTSILSQNDPNGFKVKPDQTSQTLVHAGISENYKLIIYWSSPGNKSNCFIVTYQTER